MQLLEAPGAGRLLEQQLDEPFALPGIEQFPFAQQLLDDGTLLRVLQFGDPGALALDRRRIGIVGEDRADQAVATFADLGGARLELREERGFGVAPVPLLFLAQPAAADES